MAEIPLQGDLFTGDWLDRRTATQRQLDQQRAIPKQGELFSQRDLAQFGVRANPVMDASPGRLVLIAEDPRTPEQVEADLMREAERNTVALFPEPQAIVDEALPDEDDEGRIRLPKIEALRQLAEVAEEQANPPAYGQANPAMYETALLAVKGEARYAGLNEAEIAEALAMGKQRSEQAAHAHDAVHDSSPERTVEPEGYSIFRLTKAELLRRRPDLADKIRDLREYEVAYLADRLEDALEEFYWIQLGVVLALFLDHEMRLFKTTRTKQTPIENSPADTVQQRNRDHSGLRHKQRIIFQSRHVRTRQTIR